MFAFRDAVGAVEVAFTDRHGGVSEGPWSSLNLGTSNGDEVDRVTRNFAALAEGLDTAPGRLARMSQVSGIGVVVLSSAPDRVPVADALVTAASDLTLVVRAADCVPVVLADARARVVAVAHAGRRGLHAGVVSATVTAMHRLGATDISAWLGPRICGACYEVPAALQAQVTRAVPASRSTTSWGTPAVDIGAGVTAQLTTAGVHVVDATPARRWCTYESDDLFSYRRQGRFSGRLAGTVALAR